MNQIPHTKLDLTYVVASVKLPTSVDQRLAINDIKKFWKSHWQDEFDKTGAPEDGWHAHFDQQDLVVALRAGKEIIACHLYTLHDLNRPETIESDYFSYLHPNSIEVFKNSGMTNLMSMEYLGVSRNFNHNTEQISLGKLLLVLSTHLAEALDLDAVFGTPITTSSAPRLTANLSAVTVEEHISKYGYDLCLQYIPTNPRNISVDKAVRERAIELWNSREIVNRIGHLTEIKKAA